LAASGGVSTVWALQAMGARFCVGLFRWLLETPLVKALSLFGLSSGSSAQTLRILSAISGFG